MKSTTLHRSVSTTIICFILALFQQSNCAKILSLNFASVKSHQITYEPLLDELAKRCHEVTVVTQVFSKRNTPNRRDILTFDNDIETSKRSPDMLAMKLKGEEMSMITLLQFFEDLCRDTYALPQVQELLNQKYDLVLHEPLFQECVAGSLYKLNTSFVLITPVTTPSYFIRLMGGPAPPAFIPNLYSPFGSTMNFVERTKNFILEFVSALVRRFYILPKMEAVYREALNDPGIPGVEDIIRNASMVLSISHMILGGARPFMPDILEVGGMHMQKAKPLSKDLEDFAQSSGNHGFIFFSMGSILQSSNLPKTHLKILMSAFSKLKQKVLWKFEADSVSDLPANVKLIRWAPQQDVLGHPKCKAFITHGGLGSITESVYHGVPFIGIPIFGDQLTNMEKFVQLEIARELDFATFSEVDIIEAVNILIGDPKYLRNVQRISNIYRDQRDSPLERAVFWIEYVLRHKGAVHLRSPARDLNFFQYHSLDVMGFFITILGLVIFTLYKITRKSYQLCFRKNKGIPSTGKKYN